MTEGTEERLAITIDAILGFLPNGRRGTQAVRRCCTRRCWMNWTLDGWRRWGVPARTMRHQTNAGRTGRWLITHGA